MGKIQKYVIVAFSVFMIAYSLRFFVFNNSDDEGRVRHEDTTVTEETATDEVVSDSEEKLPTEEVIVSLDNELADFTYIVEDALYHYESLDGENYQDIYKVYIDDNTFVTISNLDGNRFTNKFYYDESEFRMISQEPFERLNIDDFQVNESAEYQTLLFRKPLTKGDTWVTNGVDFWVSSLDYKGFTISNNLSDLHFELDRGLTIYDLKDYGVKLELQGVSDDVLLDVPIRIDLINEQNLASEDVNINIGIETNQDLVVMFNGIYENPTVSGYASPMPTGTKILSIELNELENYVHIDVSKAFQNGNWGSSVESEVLKAISDTFCDFYNVDKVMLTVEGESYQSGHVVLEDNFINR